jgi:hypothetical protein
MAANQPKTDMVNLAILKLHGATDLGTQTLETAIDDSAFADPSTVTGDARLYCLLYPVALKQALIDIKPKFARQWADLGKPIDISIDPANADLFEKADWDYISFLPSDYLALIKMTDESLFTAIPTLSTAPTTRPTIATPTTRRLPMRATATRPQTTVTATGLLSPLTSTESIGKPAGPTSMTRPANSSCIMT